MRSTLKLGVGLFLALPAQAQTLLYELDGQGPSPEQYGTSVAALGDVDDDGFGDLIVGVRQRFTWGFVKSGRVEVRSGRTGDLILELTGEVDEDWFGTTVAGLGDATGDNVPDFAVGAPGADFNGDLSGSVYVFSGSDGSLVFRVDGAGANHELGAVLAGIGDIDGDGLGDLAVGVPAAPGSTTGRGMVYVLRGSDGSRIWDVEGVSSGTQLGVSVDGAGDVDGDGTPDVVAGAPFADVFAANDDRGRVMVYSGVDGSVILSLFGQDEDDLLGFGVAGLGDVDRDGRSDIAFGVKGASRVVVHSTDGGGTTLFEHEAAVNIVAGPGDVDGDGIPDLAVGETYEMYGRTRVYAGLDGAELIDLIGDWQDFLGLALAGADFNGDGVNDVIVGGPERNLNGMYGSGPGYVRVYTPADCSYSRYCTANPNSAGTVATMGFEGFTSVTANYLTLTIQGAVPGQSALFFYASEQGLQPLGGGFLCVGGDVFRLLPGFALDAVGAGSRVLDLGATAPLDPGHLAPGSTWFFQCYYRDPAAGGAGFTTSDGLSLTFCH